MIPAQQLFASPASHASLDAPLDHLVACHRRVEEQLTRLTRATSQLDAPLAEVLDAVARCLAFADSSLRRHREDEEQSLFPRLRSSERKARASATDLAYLEGLEEEHRIADAKWAEFRAVATRLQASAKTATLRHTDAATTLNHAVPSTIEDRKTLARLSRELEAMYAAHIASEDETMLAISRLLLLESDMREIAHEMKLRRGVAAAAAKQ